MARRLPRGQETRERILAEALRLFAARGFARVSIEEIAEAAGVTKGAVYHWFTDKDDLGRELYRDVNARLAARAKAAYDPHADGLDNMRRSFEAYLDALGSFDEARFFLRDAWSIPAIDAAGKSAWDDALASVQRFLAVAVQRGEIVPLDPDALGAMLMGMWSEGTLHVLRTGDRAHTIAVMQHFMGTLVPVRGPLV